MCALCTVPRVDVCDRDSGPLGIDIEYEGQNFDDDDNRTRSIFSTRALECALLCGDWVLIDLTRIRILCVCIHLVVEICI